MANIAEMAVNILAKTRQFDKPLENSRKKFGKWRKGVKDSKKELTGLNAIAAKVGPAITGLVTTASLHQLGQFVIQQQEAIDVLGKQSQSLDISVNLLDRYTFAAGRAGIEQSKVNAAFRTMQQRLGEAKLGTGEAKAFFEKLNIDLARFIELKPAAAFEALGKQLSGIGDNPTRVAAFGKIFGEEGGAAMIRFFKDGNLGQATKDLEKLGGAITEQDAANAAKFVDSIGDLNRSVEALKRNLTSGSIGGFTRIIGQLAAGAGIVSNAKHPFGKPVTATEKVLDKALSGGFGPLNSLFLFQDALNASSQGQAAPRRDPIMEAGRRSLRGIAGSDQFGRNSGEAGQQLNLTKQSLAVQKGMLHELSETRRKQTITGQTVTLEPSDID